MENELEKINKKLSKGQLLANNREDDQQEWKKNLKTTKRMPLSSGSSDDAGQ